MFVTNCPLVDIVYVEDVSKRPAGFAEVYNDYSRDVWRFALALSGDSALADDLTAEAFLRVWEGRRELRIKTAKAYLLAIVRNLFRAEMRKQSRRVPLDESFAARGVDFAVREQARRVVAALQELSEHDRAALLMRVENGLSYAEIAAILGGTEGALRVQIHRARARLYELMEASK